MTINDPDIVRQRRRPLTDDELDSIRQRILIAADTGGLIHDAVLAIYAALLADTGDTLADPPGNASTPPTSPSPAANGTRSSTPSATAPKPGAPPRP